MLSRNGLLAFSAFLLKVIPVLAHPASGGFSGYGDWGDDGSWKGHGYGNEVQLYPGDPGYPGYPGALRQDGISPGGIDKGENSGGNGGSYSNGDHCSHDFPGKGGGTVTVTDYPASLTSTVTVTINGDGSGTATITETLSACTATITTWDNNIAGYCTSTATATLVSTLSECTTTITNPSPTVTITDTSTITENQIITDTMTSTETVTLKVTKTVTPDERSIIGGGSDIDYGTCSDPTIKWEYGLDGRTEYSYTTNNHVDFAFGSSQTIGSVDDYICNRLRSPCNAPQSTIDLCYSSENAVSSLTGQEAADRWNELMT